MAYRYQVLRKCFVGDALRVPGGKHDPYISDVKLDPCPSALKLLDEPGPARKVNRPKKRDAAPQPDQVQGRVKAQDMKFEV